MSVVLSPLALSIAEAARHVGLSRGQFYREFLQTDPPRVQAVHSGKRDRIVPLDELEAAFTQYLAEKRRGVEPRNSSTASAIVGNNPPGNGPPPKRIKRTRQIA